MISPKLIAADRFDKVLDTWSRLAGGCRVGFDNATFLSETGTADRNYALSYFMREKKAFPEGTDIHEVLEFYFQCCSIQMNCQALSVVAATLANGGVCPVTGRRVFQPETVRHCLCLMYSCGMYDFSGEWAFSVGLPCKSGVSGVIMVVIPRVMGLCLFSPKLDGCGNSVKGVEFCKQLVANFGFHLFDQMVAGLSTEKKEPLAISGRSKHDLVVAMCFAAQMGDLLALKQLLEQDQADINAGDYDKRTPLHIAAAEGQLEAVKFLLEHNANPNVQDRWKQTPLDDARLHHCTDVENILVQVMGKAVE
jgi:glutaminase